MGESKVTLISVKSTAVVQLKGLGFSLYFGYFCSDKDSGHVRIERLPILHKISTLWTLFFVKLERILDR